MMVDFYGDLSYCVLNSIFVICVKLLNQMKNRMLLWWSCSSQVTCVYGSRSLRKVKVKINVITNKCALPVITVLMSPQIILSSFGLNLMYDICC